MIINDDAEMATIVKETVSALKVSARHIGKADRSISDSEIDAVEAAIAELQRALKNKRINLRKP